MGLSEHGCDTAGDRIDPIRRDIADLRTEMKNFETRMEGAIEKSTKEQLRFFLLAWGVQLAAILGLYGTVVARVR